MFATYIATCVVTAARGSGDADEGCRDSCMSVKGVGRYVHCSIECMSVAYACMHFCIYARACYICRTRVHICLVYNHTYAHASRSHTQMCT